MRNIFEQVEEFNQEVLNIKLRPLARYKKDELELSLIQLHEEIEEFKVAYAENDVPEMVDAMIDLIYFAAGVIYKQGVDAATASAAFEAVHTANMQKAAGKKAARKYTGTAKDAKKPKHWTAPDIASILKKFIVPIQ